MNTVGFKTGGFGGFGARAKAGAAASDAGTGPVAAAGAAAATEATADAQAQGGGQEGSQQGAAGGPPMDGPLLQDGPDEAPPAREPWDTQANGAQPAAQALTQAPSHEATPAATTALATQAQGPSGTGLVRWEVGGLSIDLGELGIDVSRPLSALNDNGAMEHLGFALPLVKVEYLKTQEAIDAKRVEGFWTNVVTGEQKKELDVMLVLMSYQRIYQAAYDPDAKEQAPPICRSLDGKTGLGSAEANIPEGQACATCRYSRWTTKKDEKGKERRTQPCGDTFALLLHEADWGPIVWFVRRTGIPPFRKFNGAFGAKVLQIRGARLRDGHEDVPVVNLLGRFALGTQKTPTHYLPVFGSVEAAAEDRIVEVAQALPLYVAIRDRLKSVDIELPVDEEPEDGTAAGAGQGSSQGAPAGGGGLGGGGWAGRGTDTPPQGGQPAQGSGQSRLGGSAFARQGR